MSINMYAGVTDPNPGRNFDALEPASLSFGHHAAGNDHDTGDRQAVSGVSNSPPALLDIASLLIALEHFEQALKNATRSLRMSSINAQQMSLSKAADAIESAAGERRTGVLIASLCQIGGGVLGMAGGVAAGRKTILSASTFKKAADMSQASNALVRDAARSSDVTMRMTMEEYAGKLAQKASGLQAMSGKHNNLANTINTGTQVVSNVSNGAGQIAKSNNDVAAAVDDASRARREAESKKADGDIGGADQVMQLSSSRGQALRDGLSAMYQADREAKRAISGNVA